MKYTYCGMTGHAVEKCYKKHGYPHGWVQGYKSRGKQQSVATTTSNEVVSTTNEQLQKLITLLQAQMGQNQSSSTTTAVSLTLKFNLEVLMKASVSSILILILFMCILLIGLSIPVHVSDSEQHPDSNNESTLHIDPPLQLTQSTR